jgi:hypothetical protein
MKFYVHLVIYILVFRYLLCIKLIFVKNFKESAFSYQRSGTEDKKIDR